MVRNLSWDDMSPQQRLQFAQRQNKMSMLVAGLGLAIGAKSMVASQKHRNQKPLNLGPVTEKQKAKKMTEIGKGLGIGRGCSDMVASQSRRDGRGRGHGVLTLDQAYDLAAELLIRQSGKCWVTGTELVINGYADDVRSHSIDRLDDSKGYSVDNCRCVCIWVNTATAFQAHSKLKLLRYLSQLPPLPTETTESEYPDFSDYYTDPVCLESALTRKGIKATKDRIPTWLTYFDLPPITPLSELTDEETLELFG
jgi:hypothetical protein